MKYLKINVIVICTLFFYVSCDDDKEDNTETIIEQCGESSTFTDVRDGKIYDIVKIGTQCWFAENLNYESEGSWCYNDNSNNCNNSYGRFYTWDDALISCPPGWHLPTNEEWEVLANFLGGVNLCGLKMKQAGTSTWVDPISDATNESGFTAIPGGSRNNGGLYDRRGKDAYFWTNSPSSQNTNFATYRGLSGNDSILGEYTHPKNYGFSVRCVKD